MNVEALSQLVIDTLEANKGVDITTLDVTSLTDVTDRMIICTATSTRHAGALSTKVIQAVKSHDVRPLSVEGEDQKEWVLIDLTDIVVHIMLAATREFYSLEKLWSVTESTRKKSAAS